MLAESWVQGQLVKDICWMVADDLWRIFVAKYDGRSLKSWHRNGASVVTWRERDTVVVGQNILNWKFFLQRYQIEIFVCRDIYGVLGIFVFGSLVTQLLTDTSKYTIGEYTYHLRNMKIIFVLSVRSTQTTFPHCLSTQCHFDQHRGIFVSLNKFANLVKLRSVASLELSPMSWTMIAWVRRGLGRPRERLVIMFSKIKQWFFILVVIPSFAWSPSLAFAVDVWQTSWKKCFPFFAQRACLVLSKWHFDWRE